MQDHVRRVDCHVHYQPAGFHQDPRPGPAGGLLGSPDSALRPGWTDLGQLREIMDETAVDLGVILTFPHHATPFRHAEESVATVIGRYNQAFSGDLVSAGNNRFVFAVSVDPLADDQRKAVSVCSRQVRQRSCRWTWRALYADALSILTSVAGDVRPGQVIPGASFRLWRLDTPNTNS